MATAKQAGSGPIEVELEEGKTYFWCSCGESKNQPFCDGSHKDTEFEPVKFVAHSTCAVWLCACKKTRNQPHCDGSHNK